jgi:glutamate racemase
VVGTVPAIKPAAETSRSRVIGVLGTDATVRQPYVADLAARFAADCTVLLHGSARLVALAEAHLRGEPTADADYAAIMAGLLDQPCGVDVDTVVLACTHFPLVADRLAAASPPGVAFTDGAEGIARRVAHLTQDIAWPARRPLGRAIFTRHEDTLAALAPALHGFGLQTIEVL